MHLKKIIAVLFILLSHSTVFSQQETALISETILRFEAEMHIRFLASDELRGREAGTPGIDIAARYIAAYYESSGLKPAPGYRDYFQEVPLEKTFAPEAASLSIEDLPFELSEHIVVLRTQNTNLSAETVYAGYGSDDDLETTDITGKIVIVRGGIPGQSSIQAWLSAAPEKNRKLAAKGAKAVVELYDNAFPWQNLERFMHRDRLSLADTAQRGNLIPHIWLKDTDQKLYQKFSREGPADGRLTISGQEPRMAPGKNVIGVIEGTDPDLKKEYLLLSAHYDHVGTGRPVEGDSIYNGARDNAVGTVAVMMAGKYLAMNPPKRSVMVAAWTAEEKGLLGSGWYATHPPVPLYQTIFNLNIDGAGYNDTTKVTVVGLDRTEAEQDMIDAAAAFGLEAIPDPAPEQNLFDRSDNVHFARRGIPAPTYSLGFTAFDDEINQYYHQPADEPHSLHYGYVTRYIRSYALAAKKISNAMKAPFWLEGDKYEEAGKVLYNR